MKIYFHTKFGDGLGFVPILQAEGHEVIVHIRDLFFRGLYDGFITRDNDERHWANSATKKDLVIFDSVGSGALGDAIRGRGVPVFGGQIIADKLEDDRMYGLKIMQQYGVKVPYTVKFNSKKEGINFIKNNKQRYVHKPYGNGQASAKTFVATDAEEMISFLNSKEKEDEYILQSFVEGIEYSTEVYFSQGKPMTPSIHTIETKKAYAGDEGPNTGCMSSVEWVDKGLDSKIVKEGIGKCFDWLKLVKYTGAIDLNTIIDKQGNVWGLEWTPRIGYSAEYALFELLKQKQSELFLSVANGTGEKIDIENDKFGLAIRVGIPPYPLESTKENEKYFNPLVKMSANKKITAKPHKNINYYFLDVKNGKDSLLTAGCDGIIVEVCSKNKSIEKGYEDISKAIKDISLEDKFYRTDAFCRAIEQIPEIEKAGYYDGPATK